MSKQDKISLDAIDYTEQEELSMLKLAGEIDRVHMFKDFMKQYSSDFDTKINKMSTLIDNDIDRLIIELNNRRQELKQSLSDLHKNKKHQIDAETKSLTKYSKILKQKASICTNLIKEAKKKDMDPSEREVALNSIINSEVEPAFEIYQDQFMIVSHFQSIITRPIVSFLNSNDDSEQKQTDTNAEISVVNPTLDSIQNYGAISQEPLKQFASFVRELPQEMQATQELHKLMKHKVEMYTAVFQNAKNSVTNLRMKDLNELNALTMGAVPEEVVLVFEAIHVILKRIDGAKWNKIYKTFQNTKKRKQRWNNLKLIALEPLFVPSIFNFGVEHLTSKQVNILNNNYVAHSLFKYRLIQKKNKSAAQLAHWVISLVRLTNFKTQLASIEADLEEHEKELTKEYNEKQKDLYEKQKELKKQQK
eukprot:144412_1